MSIEQDQTINPYVAAVPNLSNGLLQLYSKPLYEVEKQLKELTLKQNHLIIQIHDENLSLSEVQHSPEIEEMFKKLTLYHTKLTNIKRDIRCLHERGIKLKKRALKVQQEKEKENSGKRKKETDVRREEELIGTSSNVTEEPK